jgi:hypothetical protein
MNESLTLIYNYIIHINNTRNVFIYENGEEAEYQISAPLMHYMSMENKIDLDTIVLIIYIVDINDDVVQTLTFYKDESDVIQCASPNYIVNQTLLNNLLLRSI